MDLTRLTLAELDELRRALGVLADAAEALDTCGFAPVITITDRETVIRAGAILGRRDGHAPLIEDDADLPPPDLMPGGAEPGDGGQPRSPAGPGAAGRGPDPQGGDSAHPLRTGPFDDAECARLLAAHDRGVAPEVIAAELDRGVAVVKLRLSQLLKKRMATAPAADPVAAPAIRSTPAPTPAPDTAPAPMDAGPGNAGSGNPQARDCLSAAGEGPRAIIASRTAGVSPGGSDCPPRPDSPPSLSGLGRDLWAHLRGLPRAAGFDPECDLDLVEGLAQGRKLAEVALDLGIDAAACRARFQDLTAPIRTPKGAVEIAGQTALLTVLRLRVQQERGGLA